MNIEIPERPEDLDLWMKAKGYAIKAPCSASPYWRIILKGKALASTHNEADAYIFCLGCYVREQFKIIK